MQPILIVDDDEPLRDMLRLMLDKLGYEAIEARNGREAQKLYAKRPTDVVLMDLIMPEQEGLQTIKEMRRSYPKLKIIAMSGCGRLHNNDYLKIAKMLGANRVLTKPFRCGELASALAGVENMPAEPAQPAVPAT